MVQISSVSSTMRAATAVMVGRTDPYTFYKERGLRMTPDASLDKGLDVLSIRKLQRRHVPRIAWQVGEVGGAGIQARLDMRGRPAVVVW